MMTIIKDVDLIFETEKYDVILVGTNVYQMLSNGFQGRLVNKYPLIQEENDTKTGYADMRLIGKRFTIRDMKPIISLCYIVGYPYKNYPTIHYDALEQCLATANAEFKGMKVATIVMGSTPFDGKGDYRECMRIIEENSKDMDLTVYDYKHTSIGQDLREMYRGISRYKKRNPEKYLTIRTELDELSRKLYLRKSI